MILNLCISFDYALYLYQVSQNIWTGFRVTDTISLLKFSKGQNSIKNARGVTFLVLCKFVWWCFIFVPKFRENISKVFKVIERTRFLHKNFQKAIIPSKRKWSYSSSSLHIVWLCCIFVSSFAKISRRVSELLSRHNVLTHIFKGA